MNLREEILEQTVKNITLEEFNNQIRKTNIFLQCDFAKSNKSKYYHTDFQNIRPGKETNICEKETFKSDHILSIIFYCNYDKLSKEFSATFSKNFRL